MCLIQELEQLSKNDARIKVVEMDLHSDSSIQSAYKEVIAPMNNRFSEEYVSLLKVTKLLQMDGLHLLINNAGLLGGDGCKFPGVNRAKYMEVIEVNTVSPAIVTAVGGHYRPAELTLY
jgi:NAD(P)-dependent dehydrogenase (short-subunit alcohol dehydrogenase family)